MPEFVLGTVGNSAGQFRNKTKKETGGGKVNLPADRRPDLPVDLNLLHQPIPPDQSPTLSDPRVQPDLDLILPDPGVLLSLGPIHPYLGVHQGLDQLYQEVLLDPGLTLPDPEVPSDIFHPSQDLIHPSGHLQLAQDPDPTLPEKMTA